jgi:hypothetical protein
MRWNKIALTFGTGTSYEASKWAAWYSWSLIPLMAKADNLFGWRAFLNKVLLMLENIL